MLVAFSARAVEPAVGKVTNRETGVRASYVVHSGTNSTLDVSCENVIPFRLSEATATTNGVAINFTVHRLWNLTREHYTQRIETNFFGTVITNSDFSGLTSVAQTDLVYTSASDNLDTKRVYFLKNDAMRLTFGVTGVVARVIGTTE
jgi:stress-induced morphogen